MPNSDIEHSPPGSLVANSSANSLRSRGSFFPYYGYFFTFSQVYELTVYNVGKLKALGFASNRSTIYNVDDDKRTFLHHRAVSHPVHAPGVIVVLTDDLLAQSFFRRFHPALLVMGCQGVKRAFKRVYSTLVNGLLGLHGRNHDRMMVGKGF